MALAISRPSPLRHCGQICVHIHRSGSRSRPDAAGVARVVGELLRVVALVAAPHVDPSMFNGLWKSDTNDNDSGLCPMDTALCARCDALGHRDHPPVVQLAIQGTTTRSGVGLLYDALYNWDETTDASVVFVQLREAFQCTDETTTTTTTSVRSVQLELLLGLFPEDDGKKQVHDLKVLLAHEDDDAATTTATDTATGTATSSQCFRVTRALPRGRWTDTASPQFASLFTTLVAVGVSTDLDFIHSVDTTDDTPHPWQWLYDWAGRTNAPLNVKHMAIRHDGRMTIDTLTTLLPILATRCESLERLTLHWPLPLVADDEDTARQRHRALEAVGHALFAPDARVRIHTLVLDLGDVTDDDVVAIKRGSGCHSGVDPSRVDGSSHADHRVVSRMYAIEWTPHATADTTVRLIAPLFSSADVRELTIHVPSRPFSCHTLKTVLQLCPELTKLAWGQLDCDDLTELTDSSWSWLPGTTSSLRSLRLLVSHGDDANVLSAIDMLLTRLGHQLTRLALFARDRPLSGPLADVVVTKCPRLRTLELGNADAAFHDRLVHAIDDDRSSVTELVTRSGPAGRGSEWTSLLDALKRPRSGAARQLRQLTLDAWQVRSNCQKAVARAVLEALAADTALQRAVFVGDARDAVNAKFRTLPRPTVSRVPSLRRRLALLSVSRVTHLPALPVDALDVIFALAGRATRRYVV